jgi:HSP20 family protein
MLNLSRWHPFESGSLLEQINDFQRDMSRLFHRWGKEGAHLFGVEGAFPPMNLWEKDDTFHVEAELPGLELKDLELYVMGGNQLRIKAERKPPVVESGNWLRRERPFGSFARLIDLPYPVDADRIEASLENGLLHVTLPKHQSVRPRKIEVKAE